MMHSRIAGRIPLILIILAILSAGCIQAGISGSGGNGLSMGSLSFSPSKINNNQLTKLTIAVENTGDYDISGAYLYLFGLPGLTATAAETEWSIVDSSNAPQKFDIKAPQIRGGNSYSGEKRTFMWLLRAPKSLPRDESFKFTATARTCYMYPTAITGNVEVISESEWLNNQPSQYPIEVKQTNGPLSIEIISTQPIIHNENEADTRTKMKLRVTNAGDGTVTGNDCGMFGTSTGGAGMADAVLKLNKVTIGNTNADCTFEDDSIDLQKGQFKEVTLACNMPLSDAPRRTEMFEIYLIYSYYSDKSATIYVTGTN